VVEVREGVRCGGAGAGAGAGGARTRARCWVGGLEVFFFHG